MFKDYLKNTLAELEKKDLKRSLRETQSAQGPLISFEGRKILNFCSNNYLGLANDSRLGQAVVDSMKEEGYGAGAARLICGNMPSHRKLEERMAQFKGTQKCLLFSTGYMANIGIIAGLFDKEDIIFSDRLNHASIIDGIQLSGAQMKRYKHADMEHLEKLLQANPHGKKRCIITDSVFSMDGDIAPLEKIVELAKLYNCIVMIDEAHALGVMGEKGKGLAEHLGLGKKIDIQMGTFSKAAGSYGAYCCGSANLINVLMNQSRSFIYTTGLPPLVAAASIKAIEIIERDHLLREKLWDNAHYMRAGLRLAKFDCMKSSTPIIPILVKDSSLTVEFSRRLLKEGVLISAIRPPTVPVNTARLRLTVMANHSKTDIDFALNKFQKIGRELGVI
ncbi:MAG: 8-amino-7-oxononanoate synthase [Candidatus Omnitrophica bacterium]|nr:8-amino-7-oxononanoate synthase [Candidatus Omnitrophota bacterium]